jgi:Mrp family chromosome partitioning ATPase
MRSGRTPTLATSLSRQRRSSTNLDEAYDAGTWYRPDADALAERPGEVGLRHPQATRAEPVSVQRSTNRFGRDVVLRIDAAEPDDIPAPRNADATRAAVEAEIAETPPRTSPDDTLPPPSPGDALPTPSQGKAHGARADGTKPFVAAWEVDELRWPASCLRLWQTSEEDIAQAGEKLLSAARRGRKVVLITGLMHGEGRTTLAICLARWTSTAGARTALVEADTANAALTDQLGLDSPHGWVEVAASKMPLSEAAITLRGTGLTVFPCAPTDTSSHTGPASPASSTGASEKAAMRRFDTQHDSALPSLLTELSPAFDLVLVDAGPLDGALITKNDFAPACDVALVVHDMRRTSQADVDRALSQLRAGGVHALAVAQNFAPVASRHGTERSSIPC